VRDELILLSIAVGDRTLDELFEDLGIPKPQLYARLRHFELLGVVKVYRGTYYPAPSMAQGKGIWPKNVSR
jgi:DNA-binding IclR family transcriptional regulator